MPYIGAYWTDRSQTLGECTTALTHFVNKLSNFNSELFGNWFEQRMSKKAALSNSIEVNEHILCKLLSKKNKEFEYPDTSYRLSLWNGAKDDSYGIVMRVSLGSGHTQFCLNSCLLEFGEAEAYTEIFEGKHDIRYLKSILEECWTPDSIKIEK